MRSPVAGGHKSMKSFRIYRSSSSSSVDLGPPEFVPAVVTELAGPGLCIESRLELKVGDRVLVVFRLDEEEDQYGAPELEGDRKATSKIVEDIGEVRHVKAIQDGFSIAVELIGLRDSEVSELIRATSAASLRTRSEGQDVSTSENDEESAAKPAAVQGV